MYVLQFLAVLVEVGIIGVWLWQHVEMRRIRREGLHVDAAAPVDALPSVTVIIPARNEAARIGDCIRSVLSQDVADMQLILADDRSDDDTAEVGRRAGAGDRRLAIHTIASLPPGWLGKSNALWSAAQRADTEWLLFLDADCRLLPNGLPAALDHAIKRNVDLLSLWPRDGSRGFWERLLIPLCGAMIVLWYGSRRVNDARSPHAFANGQFILVRRSSYLAAGGHEAVRDALIEDIPLARHIKASGFSTRCALGPDIVIVRMYESLHDVMAGWRRIYIGVLTGAQIVLCAASILIGSLLPFVLILAALANGAAGWWRVWAILASLHLVALFATSARFFSLARCRLRYLWLYPLSCLGVLYILLTALAGTFGRTDITWRGTTYRVESSTIRGETP